LSYGDYENELLIFKIDSNGSLLWTDDRPGEKSAGVIRSDDNNIIIIRRSNALKITPDGELLWDASLNEGPCSNNEFGFSQPREIITSDDGFYYIVGSTCKGGGADDIFLYRMRDNGEIIFFFLLIIRIIFLNCIV